MFIKNMSYFERKDKKMKKRTLLALLLISAALLVGCSVNEVEDDEDDDDKEKQVEKTSPEDGDGTGVSTTAAPDQPDEPAADESVQAFTQLVIDSEYANAIEYYNTNLVGNYELEMGAQNGIMDLCTDVNEKILSGEYDEKTANNKIGVLNKVVDGIGVTPDGYQDAVEAIEFSLESKAAYTAAADLETLKNYTNAIEQYKLVIESDSNYASAQEAIERCTETLKSEALAEAEELVGENDYIGAINVLSEAFKALPEESDLQAKITVYEKSYISHVLSEADDAFVTPATDYKAALSIINAGLQYYPEDAGLLEKKDYYASYAPVSVYDMTAVRGTIDKRSSKTDIYQNDFNDCFAISSLAKQNDITFDLNKKYNTFSFTVFGMCDTNTTYYGRVYIYGDNVLLYQKESIASNAIRPFDITVDVSGVSELRIVLERDTAGFDCIGMTNMYLQKTVK